MIKLSYYLVIQIFEEKYYFVGFHKHKIAALNVYYIL